MNPKKFGAYKGRKGHDTRQQGCIPSYAKTEKADDNTVLIPTPSSVQALAMMNETKKAANARQSFNKYRNVLLHDGLISFGYEARSIVHKLFRQEQERRALQSAQSVCDMHGGKLIGLTIHRDETTLHIHFQMLGVGKDGKLLRISRAACKKRQDVAAEAWEDLGIKRGKEKALRISEGESYASTIHKSVRELHETLPLELAEIKAERERLKEANHQLAVNFSMLHYEYEVILNRLGIAKEVLQAEEGLVNEAADSQGKQILEFGGPNL
jgi:hypothetical protein